MTTITPWEEEWVKNETRCSEQCMQREIDELRAFKERVESQEPVATVAEVHKSRYTIEWANGPLPEGAKLFALPPVNAELVEHYEAALKAAFPSGARGIVFDHWNKARAILSNAQAAKPALTQEQVKDATPPKQGWRNIKERDEAIEIMKGAL